MRGKLEKEGAAPEKLLGVLEALKVQYVDPPGQRSRRHRLRVGNLRGPRTTHPHKMEKEKGLTPRSNPLSTIFLQEGTVSVKVMLDTKIGFSVKALRKNSDPGVPTPETLDASTSILNS
jgi:hypothetical protein